jgi:hypothetical protein
MAHRRDREARTARTTTPPRLTRRTRRVGADSGGPAVTNAENSYDYAAQDPINNYDLDGNTISVADAGAAVFVAGTFAMFSEHCTQDPSCSGWGTAAWNVAHGATAAMASALDPSNWTHAMYDNRKVQDLLPTIPASSRRLIDPRIRDDPDITIGDVNQGIRTGRLPGGEHIGKQKFKTAKKLLTAGRKKK